MTNGDKIRAMTDEDYADMTYIRAEHIENAPTIEAEPVRRGGRCDDVVLLRLRIQNGR